LSRIELKARYGRNKKKRQLYNAAIRAECPGGSELLDLLELVSNMRHRAVGETAQVLKVVEDRLQSTRLEMLEDVRKRWKIDEAPQPQAAPSPVVTAPVSPGFDQLGEEWTTQEIAVLEQHYNKGKGVDKCVGLLPDRTRSGIIEQARKSGFATSKRRYSPAENEAILQGNYDAVPGRTVNALKIQKSRLVKMKQNS